MKYPKIDKENSMKFNKSDKILLIVCLICTMIICCNYNNTNQKLDSIKMEAKLMVQIPKFRYLSEISIVASVKEILSTESITKENKGVSCLESTSTEAEEISCIEISYITQENIEKICIKNATKEDLEKIGNMHNIKKLTIVVGTYPIDFTSISNLTMLEDLSLSLCNEDINLEPLAKLKQLKSLFMEYVKCDISFITELTNLKDIVISRSTISNLSIFRNLVGLKLLHIRYSGDTDLKYIENLTQLEELYICGGHIRNMQALEGMEHLKKLYLYENTDIYKNQSKAELEFLSGLKELNRLTIVNMNIDDVSPLSEIMSLDTIILGNTGITDITPLRKHNNLSYIGIYGNKSEEIKKQAEQYFNEIEGLHVDILEDIPITL